LSRATPPLFVLDCGTLGVLAALAFVLACSLGPARAEPTEALQPSVSTEPSDFQEALDRIGIPLELPRNGKAIIVNIPAFELIAFADGRPVLRSRVIVGAPWHRTPILSTYTTTVRFRPTWRPTPAMIASGEHRDRVWPPGLSNPLGLAAIRLEEGLLVYLHDTNHRELFARENRALSHGCVRVELWDQLIAWLMEFDLQTVHRLANGRATFDVPTPPVPVILGYFMVFPDAVGEPVRYEDIYGLGDSAPVPAINLEAPSLSSCAAAAEAG
jgi:murein L,D-transpeptidase YcbB/YkuD